MSCMCGVLLVPSDSVEWRREGGGEPLPPFSCESATRAGKATERDHTQRETRGGRERQSIYLSRDHEFDDLKASIVLIRRA